MIEHFCCRQAQRLSYWEWSSVLQPKFLPASVSPAPGVLNPWNLEASKSPRSSMEGFVVPPSEGWSCQLQGWRIWGWLWEHCELGRGLERCRLVLHKTLTHAEKSRVFEKFQLRNEQNLKLHVAYKWAGAGGCWGPLKTSGFIEVLPLLPGGTKSAPARGKNFCYFKANWCGHFTFTHWKEILTI